MALRSIEIISNRNRLSRRAVLQQVAIGGVAFLLLATGGVACAPRASRAASSAAGKTAQSASTLDETIAVLGYSKK